MRKPIYKVPKYENLKEMLEKSGQIYSDRPAYLFKTEELGKFRKITHKQFREEINCLGTALIDMGLKDKRIAVISENRYEWGLAYLAVATGTGVIVPLDKALPDNEIESLILRSEVEAIFYSNQYDTIMNEIKAKNNSNIKYFISMDLEKETNGIYSQSELINKGKKLIENGNREFLDAKINNEEMGIMLFTSGTTAMSKAVMLSHKNICTNLFDIASTIKVDENDVFLSFLPLHHVFECTVGFLFSLYKGAKTVFCDGMRHIPENMREYKVTVMASVPAIYERIVKMIRRQLEKQGKIKEILQKEEQYRNCSMEKKKEVFQEIHDILGGNVKLLISGAASLDAGVEEKYRLLGFNLVQGYGLTETSPIIAIRNKKIL